MSKDAAAAPMTKVAFVANARVLVLVVVLVLIALIALGCGPPF